MSTLRQSLLWKPRKNYNKNYENQNSWKICEPIDEIDLDDEEGDLVELQHETWSLGQLWIKSLLEFVNHF